MHSRDRISVIGDDRGRAAAPGVCGLATLEYVFDLYTKDEARQLLVSAATPTFAAASAGIEGRDGRGFYLIILLPLTIGVITTPSMMPYYGDRTLRKCAADGPIDSFLIHLEWPVGWH